MDAQAAFDSLTPQQKLTVRVTNQLKSDFDQSYLDIQRAVIMDSPQVGEIREVLMDSRIAFSGKVLKETLVQLPVDQRRQWADLIWAEVVGD